MTASQNGARDIRVGIKLFGQGRTIDEQAAVWRLADAVGFDHCWVSDHLVGIDDDPLVDVFEAWSMLGAMAAMTERVRIGCLVTANTFRHPGVLAKMAVTIDHLSGGRLEFGIGAAWSETEHTMLGLEFAPPANVNGSQKHAFQASLDAGREQLHRPSLPVHRRRLQPEARAEALSTHLDGGAGEGRCYASWPSTRILERPR